MILTSLKTENVLKYAALDLTDLPANGLIAISGENESGKSSIGECICFALFGRTFSVPPDDNVKLIRWGESRCSTRLGFIASDGKTYEIDRFLDDEGGKGASITPDGADKPIARGTEEVERTLKRLAGFDYSEYVESFYLAQREITAPHPHSTAVKAMAGVAVLEKAQAEIQDAATKIQKTIDGTRPELTGIQGQIAELDVQPGYLDQLIAQRTGQESGKEEKQRRIDEMEALAASYDEPVSRLTACVNGWQEELQLDAPSSRLRVQADGIDVCLQELANKFDEDDRTAEPFSQLKGFVRDWRDRLGAFDRVREQAVQYRGRVAALLGEGEPEEDAGEKPFAAQREELVQERKTARSSRGRMRFFIWVFLLLALVSWGVWGLLERAPDAEASQTIANWLNANLPQWEGQYRAWLPYGAGLMTVLFLVFGGLSAARSSRMSRIDESSTKLTQLEEDAQREVEGIDALEENSLSQGTAFLANLTRPGVAESLSEFKEGPGAPLLNQEQHDALKDSFAESVEKLKSGAREIKTDAASAVQELRHEIAIHDGELAKLAGPVVEETERVRKNEDLGRIAASLRGKLDDAERRVKASSIAVELLSGACLYVSKRFNKALRKLAGETLPKFTNGRYEHLQIDEDLKVNVFSNEKRDYMDLDEISSGTHRQIMLAVRLALAQEFINTTIQSPQMVFLDEPFAFFDERRSTGSLNVLPNVSDTINQVWITSQGFPKEAQFDMHIACTAGKSDSPVVVRGKTPALVTET